MGEATKIQWTDYTFNPWIGCAKVHTGCLHCYAEADMGIRRKRVVWGDGVNGTRSRTADDYWKQPYKWNREAEAAGVRAKVFCSSLADIFEDRNELSAWRKDLFKVIDDTPDLDWQLLTKRPENILKFWPSRDDYQYVAEAGALNEFPMHRRDNVWLGTSVSNQVTANKLVPDLLKCRDLCPILFLSCEPLIGRFSIETWLPSEDGFVAYTGNGPRHVLDGAAAIDWVIVGGESGPKARMCDPDWINRIVEQCFFSNVPVFVKQMGQNCVTRNDSFGCEEEFPGNFPEESNVEHDIYGFREEDQGADCRVHFSDKKGGDPDEWPPALRVRQFPILKVW